MTVIYDIFKVPRPSPLQQYPNSKWKRTPTGTMEINPKRQKYDVLRTYLKNLGRDAVKWLVPRDFRYCGSIKDAVFLKHREAEREAERQLWKDVGLW